MYETLTNGKRSEKAKALELVLKEADVHSPVVLYSGAMVALKKDRLEDASFLFYTVRLRVLLDTECFPPKGEGGDSPMALYSALSAQFGTAINPAIMAEPKVYAKVIERVKAWSPKVPDEYDPGYEFLERKSEKEALEATKADRLEYVEHMSDLSTLLNDAEYFAAFRIVQTYNLEADDKKRPTKAQSDSAMAKMEQIEKEKGIKGFFASFKESSEK